jgi:ATP-dependent Clp protease ATP-binding subunit ClpC
MSDVPYPYDGNLAARKILELCCDEARGLEHNYISTEHLLLALIREAKESLEADGTEGVAVQTLRALGIDLIALQEKIIELIEQKKNN